MQIQMHIKKQKQMQMQIKNILRRPSDTNGFLLRLPEDSQEALWPYALEFWPMSWSISDLVHAYVTVYQVSQ